MNSKLLKNLFISISICTSSLAISQESKAIGSANIPYPSFVMRQECVRPNNTTPSNPRCPNPPYAGLGWQVSRFVWWEWDPPVNDITSISFEFFFDPTRFSPIPDSAGFLCSFTLSGNCPAESPGVGMQPIEVTTTPPITGPANGTQSIVIGSNSVSIDATFSSPITAESDELFFAMAFEPLFEITDNTRIIYSQQVLPDADYAVTSYSCTTLDNQNSCGSENYTVSFRVTTVPEPTFILTFFTFNVLGAASVFKRKLKNARLTDKKL
jgi:hypothetical protein